MIHINVSEGLINGSYGETPFSVTYDQNLYDAMIKVANAANDATDMETYKLHLSEFESLTVEDYTKIIQDKCEFIYVNPSSGDFFLKVGDVVTNQPMPKALVDRIYESIDMGIDFEPLVKMWTRWLRNPLLKEKGQNFSERFFNFVNMKYVHPKLMKELVEEQGLTEDVAERRATMYQMKITKEGLLNGYKVSKEVLHKYDAESGERVDRYKRTFNPDTGEIDSEGIPEVVEDRLFEPAIMGSGGDAFSCEGSNGFNSDGHFIKVGCSHRLPSWDCVNTNDDRSCVPGLHVGGLKYISFYSGEIHNVFIDPMHVGAIPDDVDGAIRCLQYFVHSSLAGVNGSIYHSSTYAAKTDQEWEDMRREILTEYLDQVTQIQESRKQLMEL
tara:strand:- start:587 stop:1741 length:1155 start_codon:yes stop_codon:yes gene_type:complete